VGEAIRPVIEALPQPIGETVKGMVEGLTPSGSR